MGLIPDDIISDVASRVDMVQVVGEYVNLKRAGNAHKGLCPFHGEKTPSFNVSPAQGFFKCFGCGEGGSIFKFLMKIEGWTFPEAVRHLAARVGVEVPEISDRSAADLRKAAQAKEGYHRILAAARTWYETNLAPKRYPVAIEYLTARGVDGETAKRFGLGYAPDGWSGLLDAMRQKGFSPAACEEAGLAVVGGKGHYDRFRDRIMFPIVDIWGKTIAFSGRELKPDPERPGAKYINSPETRYYKKGRELFGLVTNKQGIRAEGGALMVEGNFDVVTLSASGIQNVVAPLGTALTEPQVRMLGRYTHNVFLAFDGDKAGQAATLKALPVLMAQGFDARVVPLPLGEDPDSLVQKGGRQALADAIERATPIMAYGIDRALEGVDGAPIEERVTALARAGEILSAVDDKVVWRHYAEEIARRLDIRPSEVRSYIVKPDRLRHEANPSASWNGPSTGARAEGASDAAPAAPVVEIPNLEAAAFQILTDLPDKLEEFVEKNGCQLLGDERIIYLIERIHSQRLKTGHAEIALLAEQLADELADPHFLGQISALLCAERAYNSETAGQVYYDVLTALQKLWLDDKRHRTLRLLGEVRDGSRDQKELLEQIRDLNKLQKKLDTRYQRKHYKRSEDDAGANSNEHAPASPSTQ